MKTVNSISGGKTSAYISANYPADYNVFALVRTDDKSCLFPDAKLRQIVSDKIGKEFIGTLEEDAIIYTILDLEQYIGKEIEWVSGKSYDELISNNNGKTYLPSAKFRQCSSELKVVPIAAWWYNKVREPINMRIGFRANETNRAETMINRFDEDSLHTEKIIVGEDQNGRNKWESFRWRTVSFPLIKDRIFKDHIEAYWKDKPVRFAYMNNCVGCFNRNPLLLKHLSTKFENKFDWFIEQENKSIRDYNRQWYTDTDKPTYTEIKGMLEQLQLFDSDFNECDSGFCGI